jgi:hypothetical protein
MQSDFDVEERHDTTRDSGVTEHGLQGSRFVMQALDYLVLVIMLRTTNA